ncbi:MAG TPA: XRE family transcriptional regulator [Solirubrobacteraceae bacterium]|jgi:transcriptional regulator with XRE-family HTH domain|nr:XRE family transcriptional regulator [Solirubrobacteraceae bacterium]
MDDDLARTVGERIKRLRIESGLGVREQARVLGISASSLSALENSRGGMSLGRLQVVARHFGLHITDLLRPDEPINGRPEPELEVIRRGDRGVATIRRGQGTIYQLLGRGHGHEIQPAIVTFEPGGGYQHDLMGHAGEEFAYIVLGDVELLHGDDVHRLGPGDAVRFRATKPHGYRNASATEMALLITAATPPW